MALLARIVGGRRSTAVAGLVAVVAGAVALAAFAGMPTRMLSATAVQASASGSAAPKTSAGPTSVSSDLTAFVAGLERLRKNDAGVLPELHAIAERLATHGRGDVRNVLAFYAGLSPDERTQGLAAEVQYNEIYATVREAETRNVGEDEWREKRPSILGRLTAIIDANLASADFTPAARALALRALIRLQREKGDAELSEADRDAWVKQAHDDASQSIELFERAGMLRPQIEPRWTLGCLDAVTGATTSAREQFESTLSIANTVDHASYRIRALEGLMELARMAGDVDGETSILHELAALESPATSWKLARRQAGILLNDDEPERAADFLLKNKPTVSEDLEEWHVRLGGALRRQGKNSAAEQHFEAAASMKTAGAQMDAALSRADAALAANDPQGALALLETRTEFGSVPDRYRANWLRVEGGAHLALGQTDDAVRLLESSLAIGEHIESDVALSPLVDDTSSVFGEAIGLETVALLARARATLGADLEAARVIEQPQSRALREARSQSKPPELTKEDIRAWAETCELGLVTWVIGADTSVVVHVGHGGDAHAAMLDLGRRALTEAVRRIREAAIAGDAEQTTAMGADIQSALFPPSILARLAQSGGSVGSRILVLAHGPLEQLPFDALPMFAEAGAGSLVPLVLPGLPEELPGEPFDPRSLATWTLLGDPSDTHGLDALPGARDELGSIASIRPGSRSFSRGAFDRAAFDAALRSRNPLHVSTHVRSDATHGAGRLAHAGLELSNGDVFGVDEIRRARPALPLVFLSACETGSGDFKDAQAARGIALAFLGSGTRNLLVTLWPVEDGAARRYAVAFHRALSSGAMPSRAACAARAELRASGASPADWAAFRLIGRD